MLRRLLVPILLFVIFLTLGIVAWQSTGMILGLVNFGYLGLSLGLGLGLYATLPREKKPIGRRVALFMVGIYLLVFMGVVGRENIQIEGFWFALMTGVVQAGIMHYLIAKIIGPLIFGRLWCGWACWTAMVLDLLPFKRPQGRVRNRGWIRYAHFALGLVLALGLYYGAGFAAAANNSAAVIWFIAGNVLYYALGIGLAYALKDNRAFCKYVCPITALLKVGTHVSLLRVGADQDACTQCGACSRSCPMNINIPQYVAEGTRVMSTECTLCQTCVTTCPHDALKLNLGLDITRSEKLIYRD